MHKMFPGINFCYTVLVVHYYNFQIAVQVLVLKTTRWHTFTQATRRGINDLTQTLLRDSNAHLANHTCPVRDILDRRTLAVSEETIEQEQDKSRDDYTTDKSQDNQQRSRNRGCIMEKVARETKPQQKERDRCWVEISKQRKCSLLRILLLSLRLSSLLSICVRLRLSMIASMRMTTSMCVSVRSSV